MPICIECCYPVSQLYHVLHGRNHKATAPSVPNPTHPKSTTNITSPPKPAPRVPKVGDTKASVGGGGDVRLTQCPRCKRFADKYVEHDFVVLFIDLVLVKPQVSQARRKRRSKCLQDHWLSDSKTALVERIHDADTLSGLQTPSVQSPLA